MLPRDRKIVEDRPCLYLDWSDTKKRWEPMAPSVDCSFDCKVCGWNEAEHQRRMETGEWVCDGNGIRHLVFKSARPPETLA